jgi:hypothetical protein
MVRPYSENDRMKITQNNTEVDAETKESTRKTRQPTDRYTGDTHTYTHTHT